ncbi:DNA-binding storekeeper protein-related transcriptional regulator [Rhynchospora pubera]|uniref:DNA-binding storekeeper protein-related transcriptional regulator n=1 Tax=Rhynchospora pubera TaxID=906938 RepID=A0AAV8GZ51_9POAL|nr:DNA-binding storekeeper protein-related transcriptional regulator [Rhynchospora pubera]
MSSSGEPIVDPTNPYFNHDDDEDDNDDDDTGSDTNDDTAAAVTPLPPPKSSPNPNPNPTLDNGTGQAWSAVPGSSDESRRLFQRLWTDEEEIRILRGFLDFTSRRGTTFASHQYDTSPFYEEIKKQFTFDFSKNQLIEKLRRLKKKYRMCALRMQTAGKDFSFKSAHEQNIYDVARHIWRLEMKRERESDDEDGYLNQIPIVGANHGTDRIVGVVEEPRSKKRVRRRSTEAPDIVSLLPVQVAGNETEVPLEVKQENYITVPNDFSADTTKSAAIEETVKSCLSPLFKELISTAINSGMGPGVSSSSGILGSGFGLGLGLGLGFLNPDGSIPVPKDEKWRKQQIMELEVYLQRIELLQDHVKSTLEELKSS